MIECDHIVGYDYRNLLLVNKLHRHIFEEECMEKFNFCPECGENLKGRVNFENSNKKTTIQKV